MNSFEKQNSKVTKLNCPSKVWQSIKIPDNHSNTRTTDDNEDGSDSDSNSIHITHSNRLETRQAHHFQKFLMNKLNFTVPTLKSTTSIGKSDSVLLFFCFFFYLSRLDLAIHYVNMSKFMQKIVPTSMPTLFAIKHTNSLIHPLLCVFFFSLLFGEKFLRAMTMTKWKFIWLVFLRFYYTYMCVIFLVNKFQTTKINRCDLMLCVFFFFCFFVWTW